MQSTLEEAYCEVGQILNLLEKPYTKKIPPKVMRLFEQNKLARQKTNINIQEISRNALIIISILNLKYWATNEEKEKLKAIYNQNEIEYQNKINVYKQDDWLQRKPKNTETLSLVQESKVSIIAKIQRFFRNLIRKRKWEKQWKKAFFKVNIH